MSKIETIKRIQDYANSIQNFELKCYLALSIMLLIILYATLRFFLFKERETFLGKIEIVIPTGVLMSYIIFTTCSLIKNNILSLFISSIMIAVLFTFALSGLLSVNRALNEIVKTLESKNKLK